MEALEEPADQVGPLDEVSHEDEERYRNQNVVIQTAKARCTPD